MQVILISLLESEQQGLPSRLRGGHIRQGLEKPCQNDGELPARDRLMRMERAIGVALHQSGSCCYQRGSEVPLVPVYIRESDMVNMHRAGNVLSLHEAGKKGRQFGAGYSAFTAIVAIRIAGDK